MKQSKDSWRLDFELDEKIDQEAVTCYAGTPLIVEHFRATGAAAIVDREFSKKRQRGLTNSQMLESLFVLWASGGETCEDLKQLRDDIALAEMLGYTLPAPQTARDFFETYHSEDVGIVQQGMFSEVKESSGKLQVMAEANKAMLNFFQSTTPQKKATLDIDATIVESDKQSAFWTYDGVKGYQPVVVYWSEADMIVYDEFRNGNVPAGSGNLRVLQQALEQMPRGIETFSLRADSALYEHAVLDFCQENKINFAISADMTCELKKAVESIEESHWQTEKEEKDACRQWAEVDFLPTGATTRKDQQPLRYIAIRVLKKQGNLFRDGTDRRHYAIVTNIDGNGLEILQWHREKAGTIEHVHDVIKNDLAGGLLPSQRFGVNAAWFKANTMLYNLLSLIKKSLPGEFSKARPKRLRFALFNTLGRVIVHARERLLRFYSGTVRPLYDLVRLSLAVKLKGLVGV